MNLRGTDSAAAVSGRAPTGTTGFRAGRKRILGLDGFDVALLGAVIVSFVAVFFLPFSASRFGDLDFHLEAKAISLAVHGAGRWADVRIGKAPGSVLYYAVPYVLVPAGSSDDAYWLAGFLWTFVWMVVSVLLVRRAGNSMAGPSAGKWAAALTVLSPFGVYYSYGISAEPPAYLGSVLFAYGWAQWRALETSEPRPMQRRAAWVSWIGLCLLLLSRPNAVLLMVVAALAAWKLWKAGWKGSRREATFTAGGILVAGVVLTVAMLIVGLLLGGWQEGNLSHVILQGRFQYRTEPWDWRFWARAQRQGSQDHLAWSIEQKRLKKIATDTGQSLPDLEWRWIRDDVVTHPGLTLQMVGVRVLALNVALVGSRRPEAFRVGPVSGRLIYWLFHAAVNAVNLGILAGAIAFLIKRRGDLASYWPLWGPWLALFVFHAITYAEPRYLFPGRPGLTLMAAAAIEPALRHLRQRKIESAFLGSFPPRTVKTGYR